MVGAARDAAMSHLAADIIHFKWGAFDVVLFIDDTAGTHARGQNVADRRDVRRLRDFLRLAQEALGAIVQLELRPLLEGGLDAWVLPKCFDSSAVLLIEFSLGVEALGPLCCLSCFDFVAKVSSLINQYLH